MTNAVYKIWLDLAFLSFSPFFFFFVPPAIGNYALAQHSFIKSVQAEEIVSAVGSYHLFQVGILNFSSLDAVLLFQNTAIICRFYLFCLECCCLDEPGGFVSSDWKH